jgi:hypothetical protein
MSKKTLYILFALVSCTSAKYKLNSGNNNFKFAAIQINSDTISRAFVFEENGRFELLERVYLPKRKKTIKFRGYYHSENDTINLSFNDKIKLGFKNLLILDSSKNYLLFPSDVGFSSLKFKILYPH